MSEVREQFEMAVADQARTLREQRGARRAYRPELSVTRVISFTGGKGGVGKTSTVVNIAIALAKRGKRVMVLDADLGLANVDVLLGIQPRATLHDVLVRGVPLEEVLIEGPEGIVVVPSASGIESMVQLNADQRVLMMQEIERVAHQFDYLLIDTQAGIGSEVLQLSSASSEIVCVVTPEPTSLTDAYALIKVLSSNYGERRVSVLVNNVSVEGRDGTGSVAAALESEAQRTFDRLARAVSRFLQVELHYLGYVPADRMMREAIRRQRALVEYFAASPAAMALDAAAQRIDEEVFRTRTKGGMQFFFRQLLELSCYGG